MGFFPSAVAAAIAFFAGLIPVLIWLLFWLFEDWKKPEPRWLLVLAFGTGIAAVLFALPLEAIAANFAPMGLTLILIWAAIEEAMILGLAYLAVLRRSAVDEPIDIPIYLITAALGFSALENAFFLFSPVINGALIGSLVTGNLRFIGATLMHVLAASVIGGALALAFYRERGDKIFYGTAGLILAILLHATFNSLIISTGAGNILTVFLGVWVGIVFILLALERVKRILRPAWWKKMFMSRKT